MAEQTIEQKSSRILIAGDHNTVKMFPLWGKGEPLYLWAERGLVCWERAKTDKYGTMSYQDAAFRVLALSDMLKNTRTDPRWRQERESLQRFVCAMEKVIRQAKEQGSPFGSDYKVHRTIRKKYVPDDRVNIVDFY